MPKQPKGLSKEEKAVADDIEQAISSDTLGVRANPVNSDTVPSKWLNPDYKLNKNEIKQAKQIINEFNKDDARQGVRNGVVWGETPEIRKKGEEIQALQNKINPAASFTSGMLRRATNLINGAVESIPSALRSIPKAIQNIPVLGEEIVNAGSSDWINDQQKEEGTKPFINAKESLKNATAGMEQNLNNVANDIEPAINKAVENSKLNMKNVETQNPLAYGAGDAAEQMTEQIMWGSLLPEIPGLNPHVSNMITGQIADNLVQIGPDTLEKYNNGMRGNDLMQEVLKDEAENALWNVGGEFVIPSLFNGIGKGINAIANKNTAQAAEDVVENAAKSAPISEKSIAELAQTPTDDISIARHQREMGVEGIRPFNDLYENDAVKALDHRGKITEILNDYPNIARTSNAPKKAEELLASEENKFFDQMEKYSKGALDSHELFDLGTTPEILKEHGIKGNRIMMTQNIYDKITLPYGYHKDGHGLGREGAEKLIRALENPAVSMISDDKEGVTVVLNLTTKNKTPLLVPLTIGKDGMVNSVDEIANASKVKSVHLRSGLDNYLKDRASQITYIKGDEPNPNIGLGKNAELGNSSPFNNSTVNQIDNSVKGDISNESSFVKQIDNIVNARDKKDLNTVKQNMEQVVDLTNRQSDLLKQGGDNDIVNALRKKVENSYRKVHPYISGMTDSIDMKEVDRYKNAISKYEDYIKNASDVPDVEAGIKQLNKPEVPEQKPVKSIKDNVETPDKESMSLDLQFFAESGKKVEDAINKIEDAETKKSLKQAISDFWSRLRGAKTEEEAEQAWDSLSKTRDTMKKSGFFTDEELETIYPEKDARFLSENMEGTVEEARDYITKRPSHAKRRYTKTYKNDKEAGAELANSRDISGMHLMSRDLTEQARATEDPNKKRELYAQARKVLSNLYIANREAGRAGNINKYFGGDPQAIMESAQGYAEHAVEKAMAKEPKLQGEISEVAKTLDDWLVKMDKDALSREEVEKMIDKALLHRSRLRKRVGKNDVKKLADAILNEKQYCDIQRQLELLSTGFRDIDGKTMEKARNIFEEAQKLNFNSKKRVDMENEGYKLIAEQVAPNGGTFRDKVDAWRYLAMLANPTTHLKNMTGNFLFGKGMVSAKNSLAALIEEGADRVSKVAGKGGIERTKAILTPGDKGLIEAAKNDGLENAWRDLAGNKFYDVGDEIDQAIPAFSNKNAIGRSVNKASEVNTGALNREDEWAVLDKYKTSLAGFLKANGADEGIFKATDDKSKQLLESARAYAINQAQEAAFHQESGTAKLLSQFSRTAKESDSAGAKTLGMIGDIIVPFKKTPINIVKSVYQYSPLSLVTVAKDIPKLASGAIKPSKFIDDIAKTATGTGALAIGWMLSKEGILKIGADKSDQEESFDKQTDRQNVAIKVGDKYVGLSELIPAAAPIIWGATIKETLDAKRGEDDAANTFLSGLSAIANGVTDMTMLSGIADTLNSIRYAEDKSDIWERLGVDTAGNLASQFLPTIGRKANVTLDDTKRSTYSDKSGIEKMIDQEAKYLQTKIPMLQQAGEAMKKSDIPMLKKAGERLALQPDIDVKGHVRKSPGAFGNNNLAGRFVENFVSPVKLTKDTSTKYDNERRRLAKATDEQKVLPYIASSESKVGDYRLNPEEWTKYRKTRGQLREQVAESIIDNKAYKGMSDEDKAAALLKADTFSKAVAQAKYGKDVSSENKELAQIYKKKGAEGVANALIKNAKTKGIMGDLSADKTSKGLAAKGDYEGLKEYADTKSLMKQYGLDTDADVSAYIQKSNNPEKAVKELADVKNNKIKPSAYIHAKEYIPSMKSMDFVTTYKDMDSDFNKSIKQDEVVSYANSAHLSENDMMTYWKAFGPSGKKAWKTIPKLKNGVWTIPKH